MVSNGRRPRAAAAGLLALVLVSCDRSPTAPGPRTPPGANPPALTVTRIEIVDAPESIEPGAAFQLHAVTVKSDGSVEDIPAAAQWSSSDSRIIRVDRTGLAAALARGEAILTVRYLTFSASARILGLPAGTFKLAGRVTEAGVPVEGVAVEVTAGTGEGLRTTTAGDGTFALFGVSGRIALHASRDGYLNRIERFDVFEHAMRDVEILPARERTDLSGTYSLTLTVTDCPQLLDTARRRTYTAVVTQSGPALSVKLTGADFVITGGRGDHFAGFVDPNGRVTFGISDPLSYYWYYPTLGGPPDIAERLTSSLALVVVGEVEADSSGPAIIGRLNGVVIVVRAPVITQITPAMAWAVTCSSSAHQFEMRR